MKERKNGERHLRVYADRSEYYTESGSCKVYSEGVPSNETLKRVNEIKEAFSQGYLDNLIEDLQAGNVRATSNEISEATKQCLEELVALVTSEVGRALIGLSVMQLCIKSISPEQSIRLHKGSTSGTTFSWTEGISMRSLDKSYVTPTLRKYNLLKLNADGFMMTRSLAENYPYSPLYKAKMRGAKQQWLTLVEELESKTTSPIESLKYFLSLLLNSASDFEKAANNLLGKLDSSLKKIRKKKQVVELMQLHIEKSDYAARLLEVSMHALVQASVQSGALGNLEVKPLSQMRSANKKHGNIGDIELLEREEIVESWDAKYGKGYLREEIEEVFEKLPGHENLQVVGFVTTTAVERMNELQSRMTEIEELYSVKFAILTYEEWVSNMFTRCLATSLINEETLARNWVVAYTESLAQRRRLLAPIDEPCLRWIESFTSLIGDISPK